MTEQLPTSANSAASAAARQSPARTTYAWLWRLLRWTVAVPSAVVIAAITDLTVRGASAPTSNPAMVIIIGIIGIIAMSVAIARGLSHFGPLRHPPPTAGIRDDVTLRGIQLGRFIGRAGLAVALFFANVFLWIIVAAIADVGFGVSFINDKTMWAFMLWCGLWTWGLLRYGRPLVGQLLTKPLDAMEDADWTDLDAATEHSEEWPAPLPPYREANDSPITAVSLAPSPRETPLRETDDAAGAMEPTVPTEAAHPPTAAPSPSLNIDQRILDDLDEMQRNAIWLLQQHQAVTAAELAGALNLRTARVPGFMGGLNRARFESVGAELDKLISEAVH